MTALSTNCWVSLCWMEVVWHQGLCGESTVPWLAQTKQLWFLTWNTCLPRLTFSSCVLSGKHRTWAKIHLICPVVKNIPEDLEWAQEEKLFKQSWRVLLELWAIRQPFRMGCTCSEARSAPYKCHCAFSAIQLYPWLPRECSCTAGSTGYSTEVGVTVNVCWSGFVCVAVANTWTRQLIPTSVPACCCCLCATTARFQMRVKCWGWRQESWWT